MFDTDLPQRCPTCQKKNSLDHALGGGKDGKCGGWVNIRHNEIVEFVKRLAEEADLIVSDREEPAVGKIGGEDSKEPDTRCDGIIRGLITPQREAWFDNEVVWTGADTNVTKDPRKVLETAEKKKIKKHFERVTIAENADFIPLVCSVYGSTAFHCQQFLRTCTERIVGKSAAKDSADVARLLHLHRAQFQAAVWRAVALCEVGRSSRKAQGALKKKEIEEKELGKEAVLPWLCVAVDAKAQGDGQ
jgi:hypothetical protein